MIDRKARDRVVGVIEEYLDDQISAFEFDERLQEIDSEDWTVNEIIGAAWFHYDDCTDHKVHLSKPQWDFFQRILLILHSDAELASSPGTKHWSWDHGLALGLLASFVGAAVFVGWGPQLFLLAAPFGIVSILISQYRERQVVELDAYEVACFPFDSYSQIRRLKRRVPTFRKRRYRAEIEGRKIRSEGEESFNRVLAYGCWLAFSPVVLLFQGFPFRDHQQLKVLIPLGAC